MSLVRAHCLRSVFAAGLAVGGVLFWGSCAAGRPARLDPAGLWSCLLYQHLSFDNERMYLRIGAGGSAGIARLAQAKAGLWIDLPGWHTSGGQFELSDPTMNRELAADLGQASLGGVWRSPSRNGRWWCVRLKPSSTASGAASSATSSAASSAPASAASGAPSGARARPPAAAGLTRPAVPILTAAPRYPIEAVREAKEGAAVSCFAVDSDGDIVDPQVVELSDEIFREPALKALSASRYRGWDDADLVIPACRSFLFKLEDRD
ncbi:MAG TPA: energy transducer TonB [Gammaproteobacteria bacterium]|nr:energy transducer TonB [Gammaproteobacteria bacterium]